jgi:hypothetical protein
MFMGSLEEYAQGIQLATFLVNVIKFQLSKA